MQTDKSKAHKQEMYPHMRDKEKAALPYLGTYSANLL